VLLQGLGSGNFLALSTVYCNLLQAQRDYYRQCRMADFWVELERVPVTRLANLAEECGLAVIQPRIVKYALVDLPGSARPLAALVVSLPVTTRPTLNDVVILRGRYFDPHDKRQVIVGRRFAESHQLHPGQQISVVLGGRRHSLEIVGTAISSEFVYLLPPGALVPDPAGFALLYIPHPLAEEVFDLRGAANQLVGSFGPVSRTRQERLLKQLESRLQPFGLRAIYSREQQMSHLFLSQEIASLRVFAVIFPAVFLAAGGFVLAILFRRVVERERTTVGVLKALGFFDQELAGYYLKLGTGVALAGTGGGMALGVWAASAMTELYRAYFEFPRLESWIYPHLLLVALTANVGCVFLGSWGGVKKILRLQPAEAMRPAAPRRGGPIFLEKVPPLWNQLPWQDRGALREVFRNWARSLLTAAGVAVATALVVSTLMMIDTTWYLLDFQFSWVSRSDYELSFVKKQPLPCGYLAIQQMVHPLWVEPVLILPCTLSHGTKSRKLAITGLLREPQLTVPRDRKGKPISIPEEGVLLTRKLAEILGVRPGDSLEVEFAEGARPKRNVLVAGLIDNFIGLEVYADLNYLSRLIRHQPICSGIQLKFQGVGPQAEETIGRLKECGNVQIVTARTELARSLRRIVDQNLGITLWVTLIFAGGLFVATMVTCSVVTASERQTEIATMHALGYTRGEIGGLFYRESFILTILGLLAGTGLGVLLTVILFELYESELFRFPIVFRTETFVQALIFAFAAHLMGHGCLLVWLWRLNLRDALYVRE
jgi:putative ABC transport system permease protein